MTKQEAIQDAYGDRYEELKKDINIDGVFVGETGLITDKEFEEWSFMSVAKPIQQGKMISGSRPKSLQGIENNNGWVKIESEADLPKDAIKLETRFWLSLNKIAFQGYFYNSYGGLNYCCSDYDGLPPEIKGIHMGLANKLDGFAEIQKPKPPIY